MCPLDGSHFPFPETLEHCAPPPFAYYTGGNWRDPLNDGVQASLDPRSPPAPGKLHYLLHVASSSTPRVQSRAGRLGHGLAVASHPALTA